MLFLHEWLHICRGYKWHQRDHTVTKKEVYAEAIEETQLTDRNPSNRLALTEQMQSIHISWHQHISKDKNLRCWNSVTPLLRMSFCHSASISAIKIATTVATIVAFFLSLLHSFFGSKSLRHPWLLDAAENKSNHLHHLQLLCQSCCLTRLPRFPLKLASSFLSPPKTHQWGVSSMHPMRRQLPPLSPHAFHAYQIFLTFPWRRDLPPLIKSGSQITQIKPFAFT